MRGTGCFGVVIDDGVLGAGRLLTLEIFVQRFDGAADKRLGSLLSVLTLGQFNEQSSSRKQGIGKALLQRSESIASFLHRSAEFDALCFPLAADRLDVVHFKRDMLDALAVPL